MMYSQPTAYGDLNSVLAELVAGSQAVLGKRFVGAYLQGSFAVGDWDEHSDVDFLIVTMTEVIREDVAALQALHARLYVLPSPWAQHLEGSYISRARLKSPLPTREPLWFLDNGSGELIKSNHCDTLVVRWVARERGITLAGPPPAMLVALVALDDLRREVRAKMHAWADETLVHPEWIANRWGQAYCVLQYCRFLQTAATGECGSKLAGARWAQATLDQHWAGLIQRACDDRPDPSLKFASPSDPTDRASTLDFIQYALAVAQGLNFD